MIFEPNLLYYYGISIVASLVIGMILKLPVKVNTDSFEGNVLFPTVFVALGLTAIIDYLFSLNAIACLGVGIISALFSKYANSIFSGVEYGN